MEDTPTSESAAGKPGANQGAQAAGDEKTPTSVEAATDGEATADQEPPASKAKGPVVLIVEDDTFLVRAYEVMLTSQGFNVTVVTDGEAALEKLKGGMRPGVMLLDLMLPKLSGFEVLEQMQADLDLQGVPVVVLSNLGQPDDIERAKSLGAKDYFVKADTPLEKVVSVITKYTSDPKANSNLAPDEAGSTAQTS